MAENISKSTIDFIAENFEDIEPPKFKQWSVKDYYEFNENELSNEDFIDINTRLNQSRLALFRTTEMINRVERVLKKHETEYEREWRRSYIGSDAKTDKQRTAIADLQCEELENNVITLKQYLSELTRFSNTLRSDLQILQTISSNIREQIKMH